MSIGMLNTKSSEYSYHWQLIRDCVEGEYRIKTRSEQYLPRKSGQTDFDYNCYKARAKWADYTEQALNAMHGMIFRRAPVMEVPENKKLTACLKNFDREGHTFYQSSSNSCYDNMQTSFGGLFVDMPVVKKRMTQAEADVLGILPYCKYYKAENIMDWKYKDINGVKKLCLVVLKEEVETFKSEFDHDYKTQFRVLDIDDQGFYRVRIFGMGYDKDGNPTGYGCNKTIPVAINGKRLNYIPFFFLPFEEPTKPMLYGIAELNKHYYMQSADYENGVHLTTLPTLVITGYKSEDEVLRLGTDIAVEIPDSDAKAYPVSFSGEGLEHCEKAIESTQEQIGILGTRSISPDKAMSETSDAARIHRAGENAKLATYARDISEVYTKVVQTMADWIGEKGKVSIQFNVDYDTVSFDPNMINAIANLAREGKFPLPLIYEALVRGEIVPNGFTFGEFMLLIDMEGSGVTAQEEIELYQKIRSGEKINLPNSAPVPSITQKAMSGNDKEPQNTKQVHMEAGK